WRSRRRRSSPCWPWGTSDGKGNSEKGKGKRVDSGRGAHLLPPRLSILPSHFPLRERSARAGGRGAAARAAAERGARGRAAPPDARPRGGPPAGRPRPGLDLPPLARPRPRAPAGRGRQPRRGRPPRPRGQPRPPPPHAPRDPLVEGG